MLLMLCVMRTRASNICLKTREKIISEIRVCLRCPPPLSRTLAAWLTSRFKANKISKICVYDVNFMALWHFFIYSPFISHTHKIFFVFLWILWHWQLYRHRYNIFLSSITHIFVVHSMWYKYQCFRCFFVLRMLLFWLLYKWQNCLSVSVLVCLPSYHIRVWWIQIVWLEILF